MCGVHTTLSMVSSGCCGSSIGSVSYTSTAAMPGRPARKALTSASGSTNPARLVFTNSALGRMRARSSAVTTPRVASTNRRCTDTTSLVSNSSALLAVTAYPSAAARSSDDSPDHTCTSMPNAFPYPATVLPRRP